MRRFEVVQVHTDDPDIVVSAYGHEGIAVGDVIELEGTSADKAANNPDFKELDAPKKRGRPKKVEAE